MKIILIILTAIFSINLNATSILTLFNALEKQPSRKLDEIQEKMAKMAKYKVDSNYYPVVDLFANYTHYNSPTNLLPLDPLSAGKLTSSGESLPFAQTIQKYGVTINIPIFVKELGLLSDKSTYLIKSARLKKRLSFYKNEALVLGSVAGLEYLEHLKNALKSTKLSIEKTKEDIEISVESGRMSGIAIDKIDEKLNGIDIEINTLKIKEVELKSKIEALTNIDLTDKISISIRSKIKYDEIFSLKPLQEAIYASQSDLEATKAKRFYPKVGLNFFWSENYTQNDVYQHKSTHESYGYYQLGISMPLYNKGSDTDIQLKKIALIKERMKLEKTKLELKTEAKSLIKQQKLLKNSKKLREENIQKQKNLLNYAKIATKEGRMTQEDYLRYEYNLLNAKAKYYEIDSQEWQNISKLAVIYGNDLRRIVK